MSLQLEPFWLGLLTVAAIAYALIALPLLHRGRWPRRRVAFWYGGLLLVSFGFVGPAAQRTHEDFPAHVVNHLLLGMAAPIWFALSAPVSLVLRALPVQDGRRLVRILSTRPVWLGTHIVTAALLSVGGMWVLYLSPLYGLMHEHAWIEISVQFHTLIAGYLFASAAIGLDPAPHRPSRTLQAAVLIVAFAGHATLARILYVNEPEGVPAEQGEYGSQLMYYGGDLLEVALIAIFCWQWYRATRPRPLLAAETSVTTVRSGMSA